jgi:hypothetical protein
VKLTIRYSPGYPEEKKYISHVIFNEFLGIDAELSFDGVSGTTEIITGSGRLVFPEVLFNTKKESWLRKESFPRLPLRRRDLSDFTGAGFFKKEVPVLYGKDASTPLNLQGESVFLDIDIIGSIFFLLARYEEIDSAVVDEFERYHYQESILVKENLMDRPLANEYLEILWYLLKSREPGLVRKEKKYNVVLSHDVDAPLSLNRGIYRLLKNCGGDIIYRKSLPLLLNRLKAKFGSFFSSDKFKNDPNNNFDFIMCCSEELGLKSSFNFIPVNGQGGVDGNYSIEDEFFRKLLKAIHHRGHEIGVHPSFYTFCNFEKTKAEFEKLKAVCESEGIYQSRWGGRQHYLRSRNPDTWRIWNDMGADYISSLGYEYVLGFRAGCCYEYSVFDLIQGRHLSLIEKPMVVMDITAFLIRDKKERVAEITRLSSITKFFKGEFNLLYHNNYIISDEEKKNYKQLLAAMV